MEQVNDFKPTERYAPVVLFQVETIALHRFTDKLNQTAVSLGYYTLPIQDTGTTAKITSV